MQGIGLCLSGHVSHSGLHDHPSTPNPLPWSRLAHTTLAINQYSNTLPERLSSHELIL